MRAFSERLRALPTLGVGISTEFGAGASGLDVLGFCAERPELVEFLEVGCDLARGLDETARRWAALGKRTTYHFLDVNLEEPEDLDEAWLAGTTRLARELGAAWMCGDGGLWHVGPRDPAHGTLLAPVLEESSADALASSVRRLREASGMEVLPENPPAHAWIGRMELADYLARVAEMADCGLLLDVAHLAIHQRARGREPLAGFERLPLERVVEVHVAGGTLFAPAGASARAFLDDDHGPRVAPETWELFEAVLAGAENLRAVVVECERNPAAAVVPIFERVHELWGAAGKRASR